MDDLFVECAGCQVHGATLLSRTRSIRDWLVFTDTEPIITELPYNREWKRDRKTLNIKPFQDGDPGVNCLFCDALDLNVYAIDLQH